MKWDATSGRHLGSSENSNSCQWGHQTRNLPGRSTKPWRPGKRPHSCHDAPMWDSCQSKMIERSSREAMPVANQLWLEGEEARTKEWCCQGMPLTHSPMFTSVRGLANPAVRSSKANVVGRNDVKGPNAARHCPMLPNSVGLATSPAQERQPNDGVGVFHPTKVGKNGVGREQFGSTLKMKTRNGCILRHDHVSTTFCRILCLVVLVVASFRPTK